MDSTYNQNQNNRPAARRLRQKAQDIVFIGPVDHTILWVVMLLTMIGVVMVFSASYLYCSTHADTNYDMFYYLKRQGLYAVIGVLVMLFMSNWNYHHLKRFAVPLYLVCTGLLAGVQVFGKSVNGARRWIELPVIGQFQPSEIAKVGVILMVALVIAAKPDILKKWTGFLLMVAIVLVPVGLGALGSMSAAIILGVIGIGMLFAASPHIWRFVIPGFLGAGGMVTYFLTRPAGAGGFRAGRFAAWLNPFADQSQYGYQVIQSLYAIASGGLFGLGLGQSRQKTFLPEAQNDIIFSIICEELGLVGATLILALFGILIWRGIKVALNSPDTFGSLTALGITLTIAAQVIINVAVVTNSIPNTGVPMPFISAGGTALIIMLFMAGILLNISRHSKKIGENEG